jgi:type IV pilus assembly protein PilM
VAVRSAIGLDIGTSGVRAAELSFGKGGVTLEKFGQVALPEGAVRDGEVVDSDAVADAIKQLWAHTKFGSKKVVIGVANQKVIVRQVDIPWMPADELKKSLAFQVQDFVPMPVDQAVLDFHPVEEVAAPGQPRVLRGLLVAAVRDVVLANVNAVQRAGLRVTGVDLTSFAVLRAMGSTGPADADTVALVDIGAKVTNVVVHRAGVPLFVRILLLGGQDVTDAVGDRVGQGRGVHDLAVADHATRQGDLAELLERDPALAERELGGAHTRRPDVETDRGTSSQRRHPFRPARAA